ncbi:MAG TPA: molybdate ABC transporter permease subunit [Kiritimatiellia bacterium]|nr:molybdate ABC transporter permease subunit [Kiritimatiellia bacterium]
MEWPAAWVSLRLAFWTTVWLTLLGLPLAYWIATRKSRWIFLLESVIALPIVLPPTVIGFYLLMALGPRSPLGAAWLDATGTPLPFTFTGILIGSIVFNLPFAVRPFIAGFQSVDRRLVEASWSLGVSAPATFLKITAPLAWPGILTGMALAFAHTLGEFGVVLMLGGNIPGVTQTLSVLIYDDVQALDYAAAHRTSLVLLLFAFAILSVLFARPRKMVPV